MAAASEIDRGPGANENSAGPPPVKSGWVPWAIDLAADGVFAWLAYLGWLLFEREQTVAFGGAAFMVIAPWHARKHRLWNA